MKVVAYYRYSTDNKNQVDNSEARQRDTVERVIYRRAKEGWQLIGSYTDKAVSGTDDKPELISLREAVEKGKIHVDIIAIDELSRLSRRSLMDIGSDIQWIKDAGIKLSIASRNNGDPFTIEEFADDLSLMVDQFQNNQYVKKLSRQVTNGLRTKFAKGALGWTGKSPYGYSLRKSLDGPSTLIPNEDLPIIEDLFRKFLAGYSIRSLISVLEKTKQYQEGNYVRPNGSTVKNILRNAIYAGVRTFGVRGVGKHNTVAGEKRSSLKQSPLVQADSYQEYCPEGFESIITMDEYKKVQEILDRNSKAFRKYPERHNHKYSGLLRCGHCNTPLVAASWKNPNNGEVKITYACPTSGNGTEDCKEGDAPYRKAIRTDELDAMVTKQIGIIMMDKKFHRRNVDEVVSRLERRSDSNIAVVEEDLQLQEARLDELWEMWERNQSPTLKERLDRQVRKIDAIKSKVHEVQEEDQLLQFALEQYKQMEDAGFLNQYFGWIYQYAVKAVQLDHPDDREEMVQTIVDGLVEMWAKAISEAIEPLRKIYKKPELEWEDLDGLIMKGSEDFQMNTLKAMGLDHIKVTWELGLWRGKPRRVPTELVFCFSLTPMESMDMGLLVISKRSMVFSGAKSP